MTSAALSSAVTFAVCAFDRNDFYQFWGSGLWICANQRPHFSFLVFGRSHFTDTIRIKQPLPNVSATPPLFVVIRECLGQNPTWQMWALLLFVTENIFMYSWNSDVRVKSRDWVCKILLYKVWTLIERRRGSGVDVREGFSTFCTSLHIHVSLHICSPASLAHSFHLRLGAEIKIISSVIRSLSDPFPLIPDSLRRSLPHDLFTKMWHTLPINRPSEETSALEIICYLSQRKLNRSRDSAINFWLKCEDRAERVICHEGCYLTAATFRQRQ